MAHALERCLECELLAAHRFQQPVLDLGCGDGIFASVLFAEPVDIGVDPNERELSLARESGAYRELVAHGGDRIPAEDASIGTVFSNSVLEHIPDIEPVLREVHRVLARDGRFYATVPTHRIEESNLGRVVIERLHMKWLVRRWNRLFRGIWHLHNVLTPAEWEALFRRAGFDVEEAIEYQSLRMYRVREAVLPLSLPAFVFKKALNRWLITPRWLRRLVGAPLARRLRALAQRDDSGPGYLIFFSLKKSN